MPVLEIPSTPGEAEALRFLRDAGIPVVAARLCADPDQAAAIFQESAGPVVLKISSPDVAHKSEIGGVVVGVTNEADLRREFDDLVARARERAPEARVDGVLVAPMISGHVEAIVGTQHDPTFGPVVMVGLGGIHAEIFRDTRLALAPVAREEALAMLKGLHAYPLLAGARGMPARDVEALADLVARASELAASAGSRIESIDINPVAVLQAGRGCFALDASVHAAKEPAR
jgi:acyl-CoA synthetase (NDP forming)